MRIIIAGAGAVGRHLAKLLSREEMEISLIDELSGTLSYNMAAKQRPWSDLNMRVRLKLTKNYTFSLLGSTIIC